MTSSKVSSTENYTLQQPMAWQLLTSARPSSPDASFIFFFPQSAFFSSPAFTYTGEHTHLLILQQLPALYPNPTQGRAQPCEAHPALLVRSQSHRPFPETRAPRRLHGRPMGKGLRLPPRPGCPSPGLPRGTPASARPSGAVRESRARQTPGAARRTPRRGARPTCPSAPAMAAMWKGWVGRVGNDAAQARPGRRSWCNRRRLRRAEPMGPSRVERGPELRRAQAATRAPGGGRWRRSWLWSWGREVGRSLIPVALVALLFPARRGESQAGVWGCGAPLRHHGLSRRWLLWSLSLSDSLISAGESVKEGLTNLLEWFFCKGNKNRMDLTGLIPNWGGKKKKKDCKEICPNLGRSGGHTFFLWEKAVVFMAQLLAVAAFFLFLP